MHRSRSRNRKAAAGALLGAVLCLGGAGASHWLRAAPAERASQALAIIDGGHRYEFPLSSARTVGEFLEEQGMALGEKDTAFPGLEAPLATGTQVHVVRARAFTVQVDGGMLTSRTQAATVSAALDEAGIRLDEDDLVDPVREAPLAAGTEIKVTRVVISEERVEKAVAYRTEIREDPDLSWRKQSIVQQGEEGIQEHIYRVSRHDGREVARKLVRQETLKEPVTEITTQGTLVKTGKSHSGGASWYAHTGTLSAANPWLPMGSYVRVTNTGNGKSVIVRINDRGPFGPGRIIDLDKVAFQEIAALGTGVVNVKMEEITN